MSLSERLRAAQGETDHAESSGGAPLGGGAAAHRDPAARADARRRGAVWRA